MWISETFHQAWRWNTFIVGAFYALYFYVVPIAEHLLFGYTLDEVSYSGEWTFVGLLFGVPAFAFLLTLRNHSPRD